MDNFLEERKMDKFMDKSITRRTALGTGAGLLASAALPSVALADDNQTSGPSEKAKNKTITVSFLAQQMSASSDQHALAAIKKYIKDRGLPWNLNVQNAQGSPAKLSQMMEDAATRKVDAIVVAYGTLTAAQAGLNAVAEAGVPLFTLDSGVFYPAIVDITSNNYAMGADMSEMLVGHLEAKGKQRKGANVVAIYAKFHHGTRRRGEVFQTALKENKWINLLDSKVIQYSGFYETTLNTVNDWLTRHGNDIDAMFMPWDEPAEAACQAITSNGYNVDDMIVVGADGTSREVDAMRGSKYPQISTCSQAFELWAPTAAYYIEKIVVDGEPRQNVIPAASVQFPAPLLVRGINMPPKGSTPWLAEDYHHLMQRRAMKATGVGQ